MELDRNHIERSDFAPARRGYDPESVDRHLSEVAAAVEELAEQLRRAEQRDQPTLAGAASEQVRLIVEAAERSASEIEGRARAEFDRSTREATERTRALNERLEAETEARIRRVEEAAQELLSRAEALEPELSRVHEDLRAAESHVEALRGRTGPLREEIAAMRTGLEDVRESGLEATSGEPTPVSTPSRPPPPRGAEKRRAAVVPAEQEVALDRELERDRDAELQREEELADLEADGPPPPRGAEEEIAPVATEEPLLDEDGEGLGEPVDGEVLEDDVAPRGSTQASDEGARLVALNMALNGTPREETDRYLAENFELADRRSVLDEVYARVGS